jgi:hypothetical protein
MTDRRGSRRELSVSTGCMRALHPMLTFTNMYGLLFLPAIGLGKHDEAVKTLGFVRQMKQRECFPFLSPRSSARRDELVTFPLTISLPFFPIIRLRPDDDHPQLMEKARDHRPISRKNRERRVPGRPSSAGVCG